VTNDPAKIATIGLIAFLLALVSLATAETVRRNDDRVEAKRFAPTDENQIRVSTRVMRTLRRGQRIDLNRASVADLELLPGIGPKLARRIVADRERHGSYRELKDLARVSGIGPMTLSRIERLVATGDQRIKKEKSK